MVDLIIHIGTFKTGTTALQKYLARSRERLLIQESLLFPRAGEIPAGGHHNLVYEIVRSWKHVPERGGLESLRQEIESSDAKRVLISAENLSSYAVGNDEVVPRFARFAKSIGAKTQVVCYVRPQWEYIDSYYSQGVKSGYTTCSFDSFVQSALNEHIYDYEKVVGPWLGIVDDVIVRAYPGANFIPDFCGAIGISEPSPEDLIVVASRNERFGAKKLEFMRRFGAALERANLPFRKRIPMAHQARDLIAKFAMLDVPFSGLDEDVVGRISSHFEMSNRRLSDRFGMEAQWFDASNKTYCPTVFRMSDASDEDLSAFDDVIAKMLIMNGPK